jgi:hypothetical protein
MLTLGRTNTSQDPGVIVRNADGHLRGLGAAPGPSDFDLAKVYGYLPVHRGWISGRPALSGARLGLGQDGKPPIEDTLPVPTELDIAKLQAQAAREQIATQRHARVTGTIQAIAIGGTFLLTLFALRRNI